MNKELQGKATATEKAVLFLLRELYYATEGSSASEAQFHIGEVEHEIQMRVSKES